MRDSPSVMHTFRVDRLRHCGKLEDIARKLEWRSQILEKIGRLEVLSRRPLMKRVCAHLICFQDGILIMWISGSGQVYKIYSTSSNPVIGNFFGTVIFFDQYWKNELDKLKNITVFQLLCCFKMPRLKCTNMANEIYNKSVSWLFRYKSDSSFIT